MNIRLARTAIAVAALAIAGTTAAQAEQATTRFYRQELATAAGQRAVLVRMQRAAKHACETDNTLAARIYARGCAAELTAQMVASSGDTALAALHGGKNVQFASSGR